jgi:hypothetical protein
MFRGLWAHLSFSQSGGHGGAGMTNVLDIRHFPPVYCRFTP